ncbi:WWOX, partial [Symbiodinium sp. KB8]
MRAPGGLQLLVFVAGLTAASGVCNTSNLLLSGVATIFSNCFSNCSLCSSAEIVFAAYPDLDASTVALCADREIWRCTLVAPFNETCAPMITEAQKAGLPVPDTEAGIEVACDPNRTTTTTTTASTSTESDLPTSGSLSSLACGWGVPPDLPAHRKPQASQCQAAGELSRDDADAANRDVVDRLDKLKIQRAFQAQMAAQFYKPLPFLEGLHSSEAPRRREEEEEEEEEEEAQEVINVPELPTGCAAIGRRPYGGPRLQSQHTDITHVTHVHPGHGLEQYQEAVAETLGRVVVMITLTMLVVMIAKMMVTLATCWTEKDKEKEKPPKTEAELEEERKRKEQEEKEEEELEKACEKWCGVVCKILILVPIVVTYILLPLRELALRPVMYTETRNLLNKRAVVTGGCSGMGLQAATSLAQSGASVILGCRSEALKKVGKSKAQFGVWSLELESFDSVRSFAQRYLDSVGTLHLLINNAGTSQGCRLTDDGIEASFQVNYLSPFLLTNLLLPALQAGSPSRIVNVVCREGYLRPARGWQQRFPEGVLQGWLGLPVPIQEPVRVGSRRIAAASPSTTSSSSGASGAASHDLAEDSEPEPENGGAIEWAMERCRAGDAYSNAKLASLTFSLEMERRLRNAAENDGITSHAINPNTVLTDFQKSLGATSERSAMSYLPPVWIAGKASGGGLFDDTETAFTKCGRAAAFCGRVPTNWLPAVSLDEQASKQLWKVSEDIVGLE